MGGRVGAHQPGRIDLRVELGGRQGRVTEEFLDGAEFPLPGKEMRGEGVAQGVRRRSVGQAEGAPSTGDRVPVSYTHLTLPTTRIV